MKRRSRLLWIGIAAGVLMAAALASIVRFALPEGPPRGAIVVPRDVETVEAAIAAAAQGGTIFVERGANLSAGSLVIDVAELTLIGSGLRIESRGSEPAIAIRADGVTVSDLDVTAESVGIRLESDDCTLESLSVRSAAIGIQLSAARRCEMERLEIDGGRVGIELIASVGNTLRDVMVREAGEVGLKLLQSLDNTVEGVVVEGAPTGIVLEQGSAGNVLKACRIERASGVGLALRASNENRLKGLSLSDVGIGILLDAVTGTTIEESTVERAETAALSLRQSAQNRITECSILDVEGSGITLEQSAENSLSSCEISACGASGIRMASSDRNLVSENLIRESTDGVSIIDSDACRVLRNDVSACARVGLKIDGGNGTCVLDNRIERGTLGLALVAAEACVLVRNRVEGASLAGAAIVAGGGEHRLEENAVEESQVGVLLAGSGRDVVLGHDFIANGIGLLLVRPASGVRIEGNHFERNATGLALAASDEDLFQRFAGIGIEADVSSGDLAAPVLVNNTFSGNSGADLVNRTESPLFAAGNWWEDRDGPTTVGVVRLEESSWKGTVAVGTERGEAREVLGRILQFALEDAEYRVIDLVGIGDAELVADAFRARDVDLIWWGTESVREASGVRTVETGVRDGWTAIASPAIVAEIEEPTLSALGDYAREAGRSIRFAAPERFGSDRFSTLLDAYGLQETVAGITWAGDLNEAEAMVKFAAADVAFVANLEETLTSSGFTRLEDDRNALAALPLYVALSADLLERHPGIEQILSGLGEALTTDVLHDLVGRVRLLDEDPEAVARQFLSAWKLEE